MHRRRHTKKEKGGLMRTSTESTALARCHLYIIITQNWNLLLPSLIMTTFHPAAPLSLSLSQCTDGYLIISDHGLMKQKFSSDGIFVFFFWSNQHFTNYTHPLSSNKCSLASSTGFNLASRLAFSSNKIKVN